MKTTGKIAWVVTVSLLAGICSGCGVNAETAKEGIYAAATGMENTPIIEYTLPQLTANVLVNRLGYQAAEEKMAAVKGKELPEEFRLVNADTGETAYQGSIEKVSYNAEMDLFLGYAVFDEYETPGNYYVECDIIGRSDTFSIVPELYIQLFEELTRKLLIDCGQQAATLAEVTELLTAYEWYPELFEDGDKNDVPDILEQLADWFEIRENSGEDAQDVVLNAALLATFIYLYQKYDKKYATTCLQRASSLFDKTQNTMQKDAESFFALTELYKASGLSSYRKQILEYKAYFENSGGFGSEREYLYGAMTYMVTRQKVDVELCNTLLDKMMDRGEEISNRIDDMTHPVAAKNNGTEDILTQASEMIFVNYVLNSYQYHKILEDFFHYLGGRNLQSVVFYPREEDCTGYLLLLAQLAAMSMPEEATER